MGPEFSGNLTCQKMYSNDTVSSQTCRVTPVRVKMLGDPEVREGGSATFRCYNAPYSPSTVTWTLTNSTGHTLDLGTCDTTRNCSSPHTPDINVTRPTDFKSYLQLGKVQRNMGSIACSYAYNGSTETDDVTLAVYSAPLVDNCLVNICRHNWSAMLSCDVTNLFSSNNIYEFQVHEYVKVLQGVKLRPADSYIFHGRRSFRDVLTAFVNGSDNEEYYKGRITYSWPISPLPVVDTHYWLLLFYAGSHHVEILSPYNVTTPNKLSHNCTHLNYLPETGVVPCVCTTDSLGSPAGRLVWLLGNITIATGDYGVNQVEFPTGRVSRQEGDVFAECQLDWIQPATALLTSHVAYGPDNVSLQIAQSHDVNNNLHLDVISHGIQMKPMASDLVQWGGLCQGQRGFMCTLTPTSAAEVDGKSVTCRVTNPANNGKNAEATVVIRLSSSQNEQGQKQFNKTAAGVGISLGIVVLIVIAVLMIALHRRGRLCKGPLYGTPARPTTVYESSKL
ncbi:hypothetical protein V1264_007123 [Littorina saxatilis]|uniref:Ig-like domain-containing protein n=2 Tax=Littorina saxatilis TaxID=31220 RepID=A0AAN9AU72_9CAEN